MNRLRAARFTALLFDYDGTLCDGPDRERPPSAAVAAQLARLAVGGLRIGIATGRGGSVRDALRQCLPREVWSQLTVGYRNGAEVGLLGDDGIPGESEEVGEDLRAGLTAIQSEQFLRAWIRKLRPRPGQVTVYPAPGIGVERLWETILQVILASGASGVQVLRSSHSVDIIAPGVSKRRVLEDMRGRMQFQQNALVLCVGDRGRWPGNDYELLREPCSLSVDETSPDPDNCWAIASSGHRGASAALEFLAAVEMDGDACRIRL